MKKEHVNEEKKEKWITVLSVLYSIPIAFLLPFVIQMGSGSLDQTLHHLALSPRPQREHMDLKHNTVNVRRGLLKSSAECIMYF